MLILGAKVKHKCPSLPKKEGVFRVPPVTDGPALTKRQVFQVQAAEIVSPWQDL